VDDQMHTEEGREVFSMYPITCTAPKPELQAGLVM
jgi:hypothetical protein